MIGPCVRCWLPGQMVFRGYSFCREHFAVVYFGLPEIPEIPKSPLMDLIEIQQAASKIYQRLLKETGEMSQEAKVPCVVCALNPCVCIAEVAATFATNLSSEASILQPWPPPVAAPGCDVGDVKPDQIIGE